jgi:aryl-alcohol dehydrogenase-like predicted oxidoreductase
VVLATKVHFPLTEGRNQSGNSRRWIVRAVEDSLTRLQTDWIDLYQVHRPDDRTAIEETLSVLTDLVQQGKIRAFGCSTFPAERIVDAYHVSRDRGLGRFWTEQPPYSLLARGIEANVLPTCRRLGMGVLTWSPLAWGFLSGKYRKNQPIDLSTGRPTVNASRFDPADPVTQAKLDVVEQIVEVADGLGATLPQLAVAFVATHPDVTSVILGPRTADQLDSLLGGMSLELDDATLDRIDEIVPPGTNVYPPDGAWRPAEIADPRLRRRRAGSRSAG